MGQSALSPRVAGGDQGLKTGFPVTRPYLWARKAWMGSTSKAAFLQGRAEGPRVTMTCPQHSGLPAHLLARTCAGDCGPHFLAVAAFCRFQSLSVPSSEAVSSADWLWWKARERMPS